MAGQVTRDEFNELAAEVAGEKIVTRHILEQTRRNGDDLATVKTRLDGLDRKVDGLDRKVDSLDRMLGKLIKDLPTIVGDTMRQVLGERGKRN